MAVEYLQGELQRATKTLDLQESLVNGWFSEFSLSRKRDDYTKMGPDDFVWVRIRVRLSLGLPSAWVGVTSSPPQFGQTFFISPAHFSQKVHS